MLIHQYMSSRLAKTTDVYFIGAKKKKIFFKQIIWTTYRIPDDEPETKLTDFDGSLVSNRELIQRCKVNVTPILIFLGPNGNEVASSLVGFLTVDFYGTYLDLSLEGGRAHLLSKTN